MPSTASSFGASSNRTRYCSIDGGHIVYVVYILNCF